MSQETCRKHCDAHNIRCCRLKNHVGNHWHFHGGAFLKEFQKHEWASETKNTHQIQEQVKRLQSKRAGSVFPKEFEDGWLYGLLWVLDRNPIFDTRKQVLDWIKEIEARIDELP